MIKQNINKALTAVKAQAQCPVRAFTCRSETARH